jgi:hypothetical protein
VLKPNDAVDGDELPDSGMEPGWVVRGWVKLWVMLARYETKLAFEANPSRRPGFWELMRARNLASWFVGVEDDEYLLAPSTGAIDCAADDTETVGVDGGYSSSLSVGLKLPAPTDGL